MGIIRLLSPLIYRLQVQGGDQLPADGGCILAANHVNVLDVFPLQMAIPRPIFYMAKSELHRNPLLDALLRQLGSFPVDRGGRDGWAMEHAQGLLNKGRLVGIFPEGTRSRGRGLRPGKSGAARLAIATGCPIVPVGITGVDDSIGLGGNRMTIHIRIGRPLSSEADAEATELTDLMMYSIAALLPERLRGAYSSLPPGFPELAHVFDSVRP